MKSKEVNHSLSYNKLFLDPSRIWKYSSMEKATLHDFFVVWSGRAVSQVLSPFRNYSRNALVT